MKCGKEYDIEAVKYYCQSCGTAGCLDVLYDYSKVAQQITRASLYANANYSMWRYMPALPLEGMRGIQPLRTGWTPLYTVDRLRHALGLKDFYIKDDSRNPTGSLKDRASAVGIAKAIELGRDTVCAASTGNAASSLTGFAASAGIPAFIFVPETAPEAKVTQLLIFGATVFLVRGTYDEAYELCLSAAEEFGWYNRSCAINPYLVEGKKTIGYEICEQLKWDVPDVVVMSVGDGCSISAAWKGFRECFRLGLTDRMPKMVGIQAANANPVTRAYNEGTMEFEYRRPETVADSISVGIPRNGIRALKAVKDSGGFFLDVTDEEILDAMRFMARHTGVFGEPAGVTSFAGVRKLLHKGLLTGEEKIVSVVTGSGLKDIRSAALAAGKPLHVDPDMKSLHKILGGSK